VTRAPTHCPYPYANQGVNVTSNLTVDSDTATTAAGAVPAAMTTVVNATNNTTVSLGTPDATVKTVISVDNVALVKPLTVEAYIKEPPANQSIG
jgi:cobalamin biosynthesis protein CbiD